MADKLNIAIKTYQNFHIFGIIAFEATASGPKRFTANIGLLFSFAILSLANY